MASQLAEAYHEVARIGTSQGTAQSCWRDLMGYLSSSANVDELRGVSIDEDVQSVENQLIALLEAEPPQFPLSALYFGLFDALDHDGQEVVGFYVSGIKNYDPKDHDSLCRPAWWPEGRYLSSIALEAVKLAELAASGEARAFLGYAGQLGVALIVSRFAAKRLVPFAARVVGFDSGDYIEFSGPRGGAA